MNAESHISCDANVISRLSAFLQRDALADRARHFGTQILRRIRAPVRVSIVGPTDAGKSQLLNMLTGQVVVPAGVSIPSLTLRHGAQYEIQTTLADGTTNVLAEPDLTCAAASSAAHVVVKAPIDMLRDLSLSELNLGSTNEERRISVAWAARHTDICLWCSGGFSDDDAALWQSFPDHLKDHAHFGVECGATSPGGH